MKIRIRSNTVRIRLTQSEVDQLCTVGVIMENTPFAEKELGYGVRMSAEYDELHASFKENHITFYLPKAKGADWHTNDEVGFNNEMELPGGEQLSLLLEKDFTCLTPRGEDETDNYINPKALE